jgi:hypothetical protein
MSTQGSGRSCVFCGGSANSREHAFPLWLHEYMAEEDGNYLHQEWDGDGRELRGWSSALPDLKVRRVCEGCNTSWMSDLETDAQPIVGPLVQGQASTLAEGEQQIVAFWAVKTAMMLQFASGGPQPIPSDHIGELYEARCSRIPPAGCQVWVGTCHGTPTGYHSGQGMSLELASGAVANGYGITLAVGHLALRVFGHGLGEGAVIVDFIRGTPQTGR